MSFICTECKMKFENKPQFCDCGNNSFDELRRDILKNFPMIKRFLDSTDIFSASIFAVCILLAILIWAL